MSNTNNTKIDWSKPVQTKETPPRPVEIVTTKGRSVLPVLGYIGSNDKLNAWQINGSYHIDGFASKNDLQNVPEKPEWRLPDPPDGEQWHRNDWTEEMLPEGWRPLLLGEAWISGDQICRYTSKWETAGDYTKDSIGAITSKFTSHCRTRRPLPQPKPKLIMVPLTAEDIPPGSVFRGPRWETGWRAPHEINDTHIEWSFDDDAPSLSFEDAMDRGWLIKRPTDETWQPCYKLVEQL